MSRADKIARRQAERAAFLNSRPLVCCECGQPFIDQQLADLARRKGASETVCPDCAMDMDMTGWTTIPREVEHTCARCGAHFYGRAGARYCSKPCRQKAYRQRTKATP
jgi:hypothetical protein